MWIPLEVGDGRAAIGRAAVASPRRVGSQIPEPPSLATKLTQEENVYGMTHDLIALLLRPYRNARWQADERESLAAIERGDVKVFDSEDPYDVVRWMTSTDD
jgi:hypothetical protein